MSTSHVIQADLTLIGGELRPGVRVEVDDAGLIRSVFRNDAPAPPPTLRLARRALLPGLINVHSHAFQRALRGEGEHYPAGMGDFWSWRQSMYALVEQLTPQRLFDVCVQAFGEMLRAGFTSVGEFHYVHHARMPTASDTSPDYELDAVVLDAARQAGIRVAFLQCYYKTGGFDQPLAGGQLRFSTPDLRRFLEQLDRLAARLDARTQTLGLAPHSLRAVPVVDLCELWHVARRRKMVCHVHVEEQRREIDDCRRSLGVTPLEWLLANLDLDERFTMVHATHSTAAMLQAYVATGARICVCPITEGNLGDGLGDVATMLTRPDSVCIGTDSNVRIDAAEELRWLEFTRRLRHERRGICKDAAGNVAAQLLACGTTNAAAALNLNAGAIEAGRMADFITLDLDAAELVGSPPESLLSAWLLGGSGASVRDVCVAGTWHPR
jgi:formimidoylglutamate deiminase